MWTVNDFPAYTLISGQTGKEYAGCPVCGEGTCAEHSREVDKMVYLRNRRWLQWNHKWRSAESAFNGHSEHSAAPPRQSGVTIAHHGVMQESFLRFGGRPNSESDPVKITGVKRASVLFELPYWAELPVRHTLDAMHCTKNICDNLI